MTDSLSAAECAFYAVLIIPVLFLVVRHGLPGLLGWLFLAFFCTLRLIGGGMAVHDSSPSASVISNVGLSAILLAAVGLLHEARIYRIQNLNKKQEWAFAFFYHISVVVGVALTAAGSAKLQHHEQPIEKNQKLVKAGMSILTVTWVILVGWAGLSFAAPKAKSTDIVRAGNVLLWSNTFSIVLLGIRVIYSLIALSTQKPYLNPSTGSLAIRVVLGFLPELLSTIIYVAAGLKTQGVARLVHQDRGNYVSLHKSHVAPAV